MTKRSSKETPANQNTQLERFKEAARQLHTDNDEEAFDRTLKKVARPADKPEKRPAK